MLRIFVFLLLISSFLFAQSMDPFLKKDLNSLKKTGATKHYRLLLSGEKDLADNLIRAGFDVQTDLGDKATVYINANEIDRLMQVQGLNTIFLGPKKQLHNNLSVNYQNVKAAYDEGYTGTNVICGIIDTGIDFYHPAFLNQDGSTRIISIWDQTGSGTPPAGFSGGVEYTTADIASDFAAKIPHSVVAQRDLDGHGTHVAGSMAGKDYTLTAGDTLHGGAIDANIIFVKTTFTSAAILDGIRYIFNKAESLSKPCVINLSLGSQWGPHNGLDSETSATDALTGAGKIIVRSAGNDGSDAVHYYAQDVTSSDAITFKFELSDWSQQYITLWLEKGDDITSASISWSGGSINNITKGNQQIVQDLTLAVDPPAGLVQQAAVYVILDNSLLNNTQFTLTLNGLSDGNTSGTIERHAWASGSAFLNPYGPFSQGTEYIYADWGINNMHHPYTLGNEACGNDIISVGAFVSRFYWVSILNDPGYVYYTPGGGNNGGIASFSAVGPTADGRNKPDVVAGGIKILSARSKDVEFTTNNDSVGLPKAPYTEHYAYLQGTSMSSPTAAGAIALLMDKHPLWTPGDLKNYLSSHAKGTERPADLTDRDLKVKENPNIWDRVFGYGAVDLTWAFGPNTISEEPEHPNNFRLAQNFPNPFNPNTMIEFDLPVRSKVSLRIYNSLGQLVNTLLDKEQTAGNHRIVWNGQNNSGKYLPSGIYFYKLESSAGFQDTKKMMLLK